MLLCKRLAAQPSTRLRSNAHVKRSLRPTARRTSVPAQAPSTPSSDEATEPTIDDMVWDPKNLLKGDKITSGHIEKRLAERRARQQAEGPKNMILKLPDELAGSGTVYVSDLESKYSINGNSFVAHMNETYLPIKSSLHSRAEVHNLDPPVMTIDSMVPDELCESLIAAAERSGKLARSRLGGGLSVDAAMPVSERRTSSSLLIGSARSPDTVELKEAGSQLQDIVSSMFEHGNWGPAGMLPKAGQLVCEGLQVAKYEAGEHFLSHEDGFPRELAEQNGFQRRATVLVYLNDVEEGGQTRFDWLGMSVKPKKGTALIFFPSFSSGLPDDRTLHAAEDAVSGKWVAQQWVAAAHIPEKKPAGTPVSQLDAAAARGTMLKAGLAGKGSLLNNGSLLKGRRGKSLSGVAPTSVEGDIAAEKMAKKSKNKARSRKAGGKSNTKGFG